VPIAPAQVTYRLFIELRLAAQGPALDLEPVHVSDLRDATAELWFGSRLRRGHPGMPLASVTPVIRPVFKEDGSALCRAFILQLHDEPGEPAAMLFARDALEPVATRARGRLVAEGRLAGDVVPYYDLRAEPVDGAPSPGAAGERGFAPDVAVRRADEESAFLAPGVRALESLDPVGVEFETRALSPLLGLARAVDVDPEDTRHVVLFTESALERAERYSRRGGDADPPVESGAVLVGSLCVCPESGEMFCVVRDAVEATSAEETTFALTFSGSTWAAIGAVMAARRGRPDAPPELLVGSSHGHNFLPAGGAAPCEACATAEVCSRTSASLSHEDELWSRAVFPAQPWQLALVFGLSARGDRVHTLNGQHGGVLRPRGYHVIPDDAL
jgi:hypothetical protein